MGRFVYRFAASSFIFGREIVVMAASKRKGDVLFAINALSNSFFDTEDNNVYTELNEEYFGESGDETEANTDNEEGMQPFLCNLTLSHAQ